MGPVRRSFAVRGCLGRGGFGDVYRARMSGSSGLATEVALKVLRRHGDDGQAARRMRDEGRLLSRLDHPAIVKVHDLVTLEGRLALVTELVDGEPLHRCFADPDPLPLPALLEVIARAAEALDAAWTELRLVHRDVKPSNLVVSRHGEVRVLDFGLARSDEMTRDAHTRTDLLVGSPAYMAPERFLRSDLLPASDVFSLGATLYEGLTRQRLFDMPVPMAASLAVTPERHAAHVTEHLDRLQTDPPVVALLRELLAFDPDRRPAANDVAARCEHLAKESSGSSLGRWCRERAWPTGTETAGELSGRTLTEELVDARPVARPKVRWRGIAWGGGALAAAVVGVAFAAVLAMSTRAPPPPALSVTPAPLPVPPVSAATPLEQPPRADPAPPAPPPDRVRTAMPMPAPEPPRTARLVVAEADGVAVSLVGDSGSYAPGEVPAGHYALLAHFPNRASPTTTPLVLEADRTYTVRCENRMFRCVVE